MRPKAVGPGPRLPVPLNFPVQSPGIQVSTLGLTMDKGVTREAAIEYLKVACRLGNSAQWWVGDLLNSIEKSYGDTDLISDVVIKECHLTWKHSYIKNLKCLARSVEFSHRCDLSLSHHMIVAPLPPAEQVKWLEEAQVACLSVRALSDKVAGKISGKKKTDKSTISTVDSIAAAIEAITAVKVWLQGDGDKMTSEQRTGFLIVWGSLVDRVARVKRQAYGDKRVLENRVLENGRSVGQTQEVVDQMIARNKAVVAAAAAVPELHDRDEWRALGYRVPKTAKHNHRRGTQTVFSRDQVEPSVQLHEAAAAKKDRLTKAAMDRTAEQAKLLGIPVIEFHELMCGKADAEVVAQAQSNPGWQAFLHSTKYGELRQMMTECA